MAEVQRKAAQDLEEDVDELSLVESSDGANPTKMKNDAARGASTKKIDVFFSLFYNHL